jgi:lipoate synthase
VPRPEWLRIRLRTTEEFAEVRRMMDGLSLTTVCEEAPPEHLRVLVQPPATFWSS